MPVLLRLYSSNYLISNGSNISVQVGAQGGRLSTYRYEAWTVTNHLAKLFTSKATQTHLSSTSWHVVESYSLPRAREKKKDIKYVHVRHNQSREPKEIRHKSHIRSARTSPTAGPTDSSSSVAILRAGYHKICWLLKWKYRDADNTKSSFFSRRD